MTTSTKFFAAIEAQGQLSGAVYGLGSTEAEALEDAQRGEAGAYAIVPCTPDARAWIEFWGGAPQAEVSVSRRGVCLACEEA